jgi:sigma-B regulation protein RsbU (phosphoserine phosphatase)
MCVPLIVKDRMIGLLYVDSKASAGEFTDADLTLFKALAGQVAVAVDSARLLRHYLDKQRLQEEMNVARQIQLSLLPRGGMKVEGMEIQSLYEACDEASGDYFDYILRDGNKLGLVVGDVAGHGVGAALVMSTARALLRAFAATDSSPEEVITRLNRFLSEDVETGNFMTLFYGEVSLAERRLVYVRAGHNEPLLYRRETGEFEELGEGGVALGLIDDFEFEVAGPVRLDPGDLLLLYTDGIIEAMDPASEQFGKERLKTILSANRDLSARELVSRIRQAVRGHAGTNRQEDDYTLVLARMT